MKSKSLILLAAIFLLPSIALAGGTITPGSNVGSQDRSVSDSSTVIGYFEANSSYCCEFYAMDNLQYIKEMSTSVTANSLDAETVTAIDRTRTTPVMSAAYLTIGPAPLNANRLCFTATGSGGHLFTFTDVSADPIDVRYECNETSLYGGFNTNANPFNFLEITNTANNSISGKIYAQTFDGTLVINGQDFTVNAGQRIDVDVHSAAGANVFGTIKITHDGPLGSIIANTSYYQADLTLRGTIPAVTRER